VADEAKGRWLEGLVRSRLAMWLVFAVYFLVYLSVTSISRSAGLVVVVVGVAAMLALLWRVRRRGAGGLSTVCEECGSQLPSAMGMPRPVCVECGARQSWARGR